MRLGVALLVPAPLDSEIDGLRRALGDGALERVPPHLTLVPPVNVRVEDLPEALAVLRQAAARHSPFVARLGPPTTFAPATATVHLGVHEDEGGEIVRRLRDDVFVGPLERTLTFGFEPHVTLADDALDDRRAAALVALSDYVVEVPFDRVHLLQEQRHGDAHRRWVPVADVPFGPRRVVGRGGVELELVVSSLLDPEAAAFESGEWPDDEPHSAATAVPAGCRPVVVTARRRGEVVGVARGGVGPDRRELCSVLVARDQRAQGVARQLLAAFGHEADQASAGGDLHDEPDGTAVGGRAQEHDRGDARGP
nr:2'-5' RNA ligase family protein [Rhabdothermincola salaria]